jgi:uncharacterized peroxidase-related enzyme
LSLITAPDLDSLDESVRAQYERHRDEHAHFDELRLVLARFPAALTAADVMYRRIMNEGHLGRVLREQIFVVSSTVRDCVYAVAAHGEWLAEHGSESPADVAALQQADDQASATERERALFAFCRKVAEAPYKTVRSDIDGLLQVGWDLPEIVEALTVISLSGWMNSLANSLNIGGEAAGSAAD